MSELGPVLLVLAAQVTLPVIGGLVLSRRRPPAAACGPIVLAVVAVLLLTPLAFVPRPAWSTTSRQVADDEASPPINAIATNAEAPGGIDLVKLLRRASPMPSADVPEPTLFDAWRLVALVGFGLAGIGVCRLALELTSTFHIARRGRPVTETGLLALAEELRCAVQCRRTVHLRESMRIGSAATTGWLRPVVLLSPMWRLWTPAERRAVLAHEIAHVARGDFATRLLGRLAVALHGYHPLVRWLTARLEIRQEMAADALAAVASGGRPAYLKCLASLALKADVRPLGPVPTFLSRPRTLLRRIAMLRVKDNTPVRYRRRPAALVVIVLALAALGLHGTRPQALAGPIVPAKFAENKDRSPLDASFILPSDHPDNVGVFAVRVGELLRTPGMEKMAAMYTGVLTTAFEGKPTHFELADIEQISGRALLTQDPKAPPPNRALQLSLSSIRMAKNFDWVKQLRAWTTDWKEHAYGGTKMYSAKIGVRILGLKDQPIWFYLPDSRTVVLESEENIKKLIDAKGKPTATPWADDWRAVENGTLAIVLSDVKGKLAKKLPTEKMDDKVKEAAVKAMTGLCSKTSRVAIGVDLGTGCSVKIRLACASAADAADVDEGCQALAKLAKSAIEDDKDEPTDPLGKAGKKLSVLLVRGIEFNKAVDHVVEVRMTAESGLTDLLKAFDTAGGK